MSMLFGDVASTLAVTDADPEPQSLQALKQRFRKTWTSISPSTLQHLISSMPNRLKVVIKNKGNIIPY